MRVIPQIREPPRSWRASCTVWLCERHCGSVAKRKAQAGLLAERNSGALLEGDETESDLAAASTSSTSSIRTVPLNLSAAFESGEGPKRT
jgi:hypothetical protein